MTYIWEKRAKARFSLQEQKEPSAFQCRRENRCMQADSFSKIVGQRRTMMLSCSARICERSVVFIATIGIRLLPQEKEELAAIARRTDTTISQILREQIRNYINTHGELAGEKEIYYEYQSNESIDAQTHHGK